MKIQVSTLAVLGALLAGCGHKEGDGHTHGDHDAHGHSHGEASASGAAFKEGEGVTLSEQARRSLGVEIADVEERSLPGQIGLTVQVFREAHHHRLDTNDHSGCDVYGSGFLPTETAALLRPGQPAQILSGTNHSFGGMVFAVQKALALGESEVIVGVSNATATLKPGEFVPARIHLPRAGGAPAIPQSALLQSAGGRFVYVVNGDAYLRTPVKTGVEAGGWVEIADGLLAGDQVVTRPVQELWLIELRATKGGGHSH